MEKSPTLSSGVLLSSAHHVPGTPLEEGSWWLKWQKPAWGLGGGDRNTCLPLFYRRPRGGEVLGTEDTITHFGLHFSLLGPGELGSLFPLVHTA